MDHLITVLCAYASPVAGGDRAPNGTGTGGANGDARRPSVIFGEDDVRRTACVTAFTVANRYGDCVRGGWCPLVDLVLRMHRLDLLPETTRKGLEVAAEHGGPMRALDGAGRPSPSRTRVARREGEEHGGSSLLRGFSQLLSLDAIAGSDGLFGSGFGGNGGGAEAPLTEEERAAEERALRCVEACRVERHLCRRRLSRERRSPRTRGARSPGPPGRRPPAARAPRRLRPRPRRPRGQSTRRQGTRRRRPRWRPRRRRRQASAAVAAGGERTRTARRFASTCSSR